MSRRRCQSNFGGFILGGEGLSCRGFENLLFRGRSSKLVMIKIESLSGVRECVIVKSWGEQFYNFFFFLKEVSRLSLL